MRILILILLLSSCTKQDNCTTMLQTISTSTCVDNIYTVTELNKFELMEGVDCEKYRRYALGDYPAYADYVYNGIIYHRDELIRCICVN